MVSSVTLLHLSCSDHCKEVLYDFWCQFWHHCYVSLTMSLVSCDADASDITWPKSPFASHFGHLDPKNVMVLLMMPLVSHDQNHAAPHFDHLDQKKEMLPVIMLLSLSNTNTNTNSITWQNKQCCGSFDHLDLRNSMVLLKMPMVFHDHKSNAAHHFNHFNLRNRYIHGWMDGYVIVDLFFNNATAFRYTEWFIQSLNWANG